MVTGGQSVKGEFLTQSGDVQVTNDASHCADQSCNDISIEQLIQAVLRVLCHKCREKHGGYEQIGRHDRELHRILVPQEREEAGGKMGLSRRVRKSNVLVRRCKKAPGQADKQEEVAPVVHVNLETLQCRQEGDAPHNDGKRLPRRGHKHKTPADEPRGEYQRDE